ncbi:WXG100 family type VII secretion target [Lentzea sp. NPDC102401]|uniref:WXG100 family type VII secretion target n=1 Tax=Lentzea sp. NPDC102401 TaxID=3364128 RepID=UPI00382DB0CB
MSGYRQLTDWNFEGWSNGDLANEVQKLSGTSVASKFGEASAALRDLANTLESVDKTIRDQLRTLKIEWGGATAEKSHSKTDVVAAGLDDSSQASNESSQAMTQQGESTSQARYSTPPPQDLRGDTEKNFGDKVGGFFGVETDHAKEVAATNAARQQAIDSLNGYVTGSQGSLDSFRAPNTPPDIVVASGAVSTPVGPPVGGLPQGGTPGVSGGPGFTGSPGSPGSPGFSGVPVGPTPGTPGNATGILPGGGTPTPLAAGPGLPKPFGVPPIGVAAATAAAAGLAGGTASARGAQVVGGGRGPSQAPKTPIAPTGPKGAPSTIGGGKSGAGGAGAGGTGAAGKGPGGAMTPGGASGVGPEAGRAGAAAGKGGVGGKGAGSLMSPAASAAKGEEEEDGEHVRKYGVDSDEMFGDDRMVVQSVIGEDPKDK